MPEMERRGDNGEEPSPPIQDNENTIGTLRELLVAGSRRFGGAAKLILVGVLILLLLIPLGMVWRVMEERRERRDEVIWDIHAAWGGHQNVVGPVLMIPYLHHTTKRTERIVGGRCVEVDVEETSEAWAWFLPESLEVEASVQPSTRRRSIYEAVVYEGALELTGRFAPPDFAPLGIDEKDILWNKAAVTLAVSDLRGTNEVQTIRIGKREFPMEPGCRLRNLGSGLTARLGKWSRSPESLNFAMSLQLRGSRGLRFAPLGKVTRVHMTSPWPAPSFQGGTLPTSWKATETGFEANWQASWYARSYPQQATSQQNGVLSAGHVRPSLFGVDFLIPVNTYRLIQRALKYGVLFLVVVFGTFFLFETLVGLHIHPIRYVLIGIAMCLFYLAVLSLSEFIPFAWAYWTGAAAAALLIVLYSRSALRDGRRAAGLGAVLAGIYSYLFCVLHVQDYALLLGTALLFVLLAVAMVATRRVEEAGNRGEKGA